ncbi:unnamed protein product [Closterium sp. Naga37s-1]|nr:unnamed protein product [Closterium sp. Naga37s-1]
MTPPATLPFDQGRDGGGRERPPYTRQSAFEAQGLAWSGQVEGEFRRQEEGQGEGKEERMEGQGEGVAVVEDEERETFSYLDDERFNECTQLLKKLSSRTYLPCLLIPDLLCLSALVIHPPAISPAACPSESPPIHVQTRPLPLCLLAHFLPPSSSPPFLLLLLPFSLIYT